MKVEIGEPNGEGTEVENIHIDKWDTWSMDYTLALIALPMLKQLKETKHGAPFVDMEDRPEAYRCEFDRKSGDTDTFHFSSWDWVLDEMIFAFETKVGAYSDWEEQFHQYDEGYKIDFVGVGPAQLRLFPDEDGKTEDYEFYEMKSTGKSKIDWDGRKAFQERISNGFRLFGKYYESLWD